MTITLTSRRVAGVPTIAPAHRRLRAPRRDAIDDQFDQRMTRLLRESAQVREQRERARASDDDRSSRRAAAALLELVRAHSRSRTGSEVTGPVSSRTPRRPS